MDRGVIPIDKIRERARREATVKKRALALATVIAFILALFVAVLVFGQFVTSAAETVWMNAKRHTVGCEHPTELSVLTSPDGLEPATMLTSGFEQATAVGNFGCPTVNMYVYSAPH